MFFGNNFWDLLINQFCIPVVLYKDFDFFFFFLFIF